MILAVLLFGAAILGALCWWLEARYLKQLSRQIDELEKEIISDQP